MTDIAKTASVVFQAIFDWLTDIRCGSTMAAISEKSPSKFQLPASLPIVCIASTISLTPYIVQKRQLQPLASSHLSSQSPTFTMRHRCFANAISEIPLENSSLRPVNDNPSVAAALFTIFITYAKHATLLTLQLPKLLFPMLIPPFPRLWHRPGSFISPQQLGNPVSATFPFLAAPAPRLPTPCPDLGASSLSP